MLLPLPVDMSLAPVDVQFKISSLCRCTLFLPFGIKQTKERYLPAVSLLSGLWGNVFSFVVSPRGLAENASKNKKLILFKNVLLTAAYKLRHTWLGP